MAEDEAVGVCQANLPNGRAIYDLIAANNLDGIRSLLNPLTLRHRQSIVCQTVRNRTLLGYACELRARDIVKYLLDECGAEIYEHYTRRHESVSALRIAVGRLDLAMIVVLVSRGIVVVNRKDVISCSHEAFGHGHCYLASMLVYYSNRFERTNFFPSELGEIVSEVPSMPSVFAWITDIILADRSDNFLSAVVAGDIQSMKMLLVDGINRKMTTEYEDNALCVAILNDDRNAEHFLMNYKVFSLKDHVAALELSGAKFIAFHSDVEKGLRCWRKALRIRNENRFGVSDKYETKLQTDLGLEFQSEEQLDTLRSNQKSLYIQALLVILRLLSRFSRVLQDAFLVVATHEVFHADIMQSVYVLAELFDFPSHPNQRHRSPSHRSIDTIIYLFRYHFVSNSSVMGDVLDKFRNLMDFMDEDKWKALLRGATNFYMVVYIQLLEFVIENIISIQKFDLIDADEVWIKEGVRKIMQNHSYPFPTTLLHRAVKGSHSLSVIKFILGCSADANCRDVENNTPLHVAAEYTEDKDYLSSLVNLLVDAGGHIDAVNMTNTTPLMTLKSKGIIKNPIQFLSLQCQAAQVIGDSVVEVPDTYPKILTRFIELHSP